MAGPYSRHSQIVQREDTDRANIDAVADRKVLFSALTSGASILRGYDQ